MVLVSREGVLKRFSTVAYLEFRGRALGVARGYKNGTPLDGELATAALFGITRMKSAGRWRIAQPRGRVTGGLQRHKKQLRSYGATIGGLTRAGPAARTRVPPLTQVVHGGGMKRCHNQSPPVTS